MKKILSFLFIINFFYSQNIPKADYGKLNHIESFESKYVEKRSVDIWLPENYSTQKKYAVLYMNDGKMLIDKSQAWNNTSWELDSISAKLINSKKVKEYILVAIHNVQETRHADYTPQKAFESMTREDQQMIGTQLKNLGRSSNNFKPNGDNYLKFLVEELKPYIDSNYTTLTDQQNTYIAGSSMGALITLYAICEYPKVFGGVACLSTHWPYVFLPNNPMCTAIQEYLKKNLPNPKDHKIYFDYGNATLDTLYPPLQEKVDEIMKTRGFDNSNWQTKFFNGDEHSERFWKKRVHIPLEFLLKK